MSTFDPGELQLVGPAKDQKPPRHMSTRSKARKRALDILFEAEARGLSPLEVLLERTQRHREDEATPPVRAFTQDLVHGVVEHLTEIDARIAEALATGWTVARMPRVDRALVRLAVFEIDHSEVADRVAIAEAVVLADELSTDDSAVFVNGLLAKIAGTAPRRRQAEAESDSEPAAEVTD